MSSLCLLIFSSSNMTGKCKSMIPTLYFPLGCEISTAGKRIDKMTDTTMRETDTILIRKSMMLVKVLVHAVQTMVVFIIRVSFTTSLQQDCSRNSLTICNVMIGSKKKLIVHRFVNPAVIKVSRHAKTKIREFSETWNNENTCVGLVKVAYPNAAIVKISRQSLDRMGLRPPKSITEPRRVLECTRTAVTVDFRLFMNLCDEGSNHHHLWYHIPYVP
mmetsp:Transcript_11722/g.13634  ORF Transcript_11722/g.13634 Transcript_11722/m.13634 type:complete len:217 (+) Transcript_11722:1336-1986(+)